MDKELLVNRINDFLIDEFEVDGTILPSDNVKEKLDLDSLDFVDLVVVIENEFSVTVNGEDFVELTTFDKLYDYLIQRMPETVQNEPS